MIDPIFDPNDVLPNDPYLQIPLDAQPIDLEGLSAQGKQRQWIHPDNIIPTTASMHGQKYSNMQQAQVATFNDDKRLRVDANITGSAVTSTSGLPWGWVKTALSDNKTFAGTQTFFGSMGLEQYLRSIHISIGVDPAIQSDSDMGRTIFYLVRGIEFPSVMPLSRWNGSTGLCIGSVHHVYSPPIDLGLADLWDLVCTNNAPLTNFVIELISSSSA